MSNVQLVAIIACMVLLDLLAAWCFSIAFGIPLLQTALAVFIFTWIPALTTSVGLQCSVNSRKNIP